MKIIEIDIDNEENLYDKYNKNKVSQDLINYLVDSVYTINLEEKIKVIINNKLKNKKSIPLITEGLKREYNKCVLHYKHNSKVQITYFLLGILILFISTLINIAVLKEVILISGWMLIWTMLEIEISTDIKILRKRKVLKKLISCEMEEIE